MNAPTTNAALTGTPRTITVTNTGSANAADVSLSFATSLPSGTTISPATCGLILVADTCTLTVTPGATPSAAPGDTAAVPIALSIAGPDTNTVATAIEVIDYGSVSQSGYVFAVDDTTPTSGSALGKVAALQDQPSARWSPNYSLVGASSLTDGAANTDAIVAIVPTGPYAATVCSASAAGGHSDWYLPATCELAYTNSADCGNPSAPVLQNMQSNLVDNGRVAFVFNSRWSSTESSFSAEVLARIVFLDASAPTTQVDLKRSLMPLRCVRALTN